MQRILLATLLTLAAPTALAAERPMNTENRTITVSGDAEVKVAPDEVAIDVSVETAHKDLEKAKKENDERIKRVIAAARAAGVEEKRIATDEVNIEPYYASGSYSSGRGSLEGFTVRRTLQLTLRELGRFDAALSAVITAGATAVRDVRFTTTELRRHRDHARELAVKAAQEKAALLAKAAGMKLGRPRSIAEGSGGWWSSYRAGWGGGAYSQNVSQVAGGGGAIEGTVAPGLISVTASVTIVFDLE